MTRILTVGAHPDDEILGMGGALSKLAEQKNSVFMLILTLGETARGKNLSNGSLRTKQAKKIAGKLGATLFPIQKYPDCAFDSVPLLSLTKTVEEYIKEAKPDVIYTCHGGDLNIDHQRTFQAVMTAARPGKTSVKRIYSFEVLSTTEWQAKSAATVFLPNTYIDIEQYIDNKIDLMKIYPQEMAEFPFPRSGMGIKTLARLRGMESGLKFAEAFQLIRNIDR